METAKKMQDLKPHLDKLSKKHGTDRQKLQQAQLRLYQEAGINPASGCLSLIIQIPIFIALYQALLLFLSNGGAQNMAKVVDSINKVLYIPALRITNFDLWFFGFNLAQTPQKAGIWFYYTIPLLTALLQYYQAKVSSPPSVPVDKSKGEKASSQADFQKAMQTQMKYIFPLLIGWFAYILPVGLSLYWNVFSIFSIIQYRKLKT